MSIVDTLIVSRTLDETSLATDLRSDFVVRETCRGKDWDFLPTSCILRVLLALFA